MSAASRSRESDHGLVQDVLTFISVTTAQVLFSVALGVIGLIIVSFALYVVCSTAWGNRWVGKKKQSNRLDASEEP